MSFKLVIGSNQQMKLFFENVQLEETKAQVLCRVSNGKEALRLEKRDRGYVLFISCSLKDRESVLRIMKRMKRMKGVKSVAFERRHAIDFVSLSLLYPFYVCENSVSFPKPCTVIKLDWRTHTLFDAIKQRQKDSWTSFLSSSIENLTEVKERIEKDKKKYPIFPPLDLVFKAFDLQLPDIRVILIGQDPYFNYGEAMGLCFSVPKKVTIPSSLRNVFTEMKNDLGVEKPSHGDLTSWMKQGVFMINTSLTVPGDRTMVGSHIKLWALFMRSLFRKINDEVKKGVVIMWGTKAQEYKKIFSSKGWKFIESAHPSGLSASRGFYGSKPFSKTNKYLKDMGLKEIKWDF